MNFIRRLMSGERMTYHVTDFLHRQLLDGDDETPLDEYDLSDAFTGADARFQVSDTVQIGEKNRVLAVCIIASFLLHFGLMYAVPRFIGVPRPDSILKPGEKVTQVRLVEPQPTESKPEPPPDNASAISDRNHVTEKERIPKLPPAPRPPLGKVEPTEKRMASLAPPVAPEDAVKPKEDPKPQEEAHKVEESPKPLVHQPQPKNGRSKTKETVEPKPAKKRQRHVDLRPTRSEMETAISGPGGAPDFYPDGDVEEAVVDINTREDRFFSYLLHLKRKIQGVWVYPSVAAKSGIGGSLTVEFSIARNGELLYVNLLDSSGHTILDESAMSAIRTAAPYFPFPERMRAKRLRVRANFIYITQNFFRSIM